MSSRDTLLGYAKEVSGKPEEIRNIVADWRAAAGDVNEFASGVGAAVRNVDSAWQGDSAQNFVSYMSEYGRAADHLHDALAACATALESVATELADAKPKIDGLVSDASVEEATYKKEHPNATPEETSAKSEEIYKEKANTAAEHVGKVRTAVSEANKAMGKLGSEFLNSKTTFAAITEAEAKSFVPVHGKKVDWQRTPGYRPPKVTKGGNGGSGGGFGGYGPSGPPPPAGGGPAPTGKIKEWIEEATKILAAQGYSVAKMNANDIWMIIQNESAGNPHAINNWDSNAEAGTPSKGLMQTIDPTFSQWSLPGHKDIWNPVDNIIAGVRYAIAEYGSVSNVPGVVAVKKGLDYRGY
ncbi:WXG100 family type VII secretion target [Nonomuraea sp. NPDC049152]|uniref:transglycosylase SLT domain-containing protein n=1 Tax=Nonomuraea sp. NPDC049152 TaxID=3154350 RepID=UPI0034023AFC